MISVDRPELDERTKRLLSHSTSRLGRQPTVAFARKKWYGAKGTRNAIRGILEATAPGISRCMYCGDSQGTDIDHFKPIAKDPLGTFDWFNHLLACSYCNSNQKRNLFPCDSRGNPLLINPSLEDPYDHIRLTLNTGTYSPLTKKGEATIEVFALSRASLERGRTKAFVRCKSMLRDWKQQTQDGNRDEAQEVKASLYVQPFADVLVAMLRSASMPGAVAVFGSDVVEVLTEWNQSSPT